MSPVTTGNAASVVTKKPMKTPRTANGREVAQIKTPTLMLFAVDTSAAQPDPAKYEAMVRAGYQPMPNVTLVKVDGSRHFIMYDQPDKMDAAIEGFLK